MTDKKLELLKKYIEFQANDDGLWFKSERIMETYIQEELRRVAFLIEEATEKEIEITLANYKHRLMHD